ncbi:hypothetical protein [Shewanella glacialimarina]|uniref:hypothetical protein n=1 Tax=Shewanella glacialimarina TaxID=2590884 RepID=UPI001CF8BEAE|nr:hypothetical protein [Shewanella glacialimarina]UCX03318.1 hypothetical protein FJ709_01555 [Shewanella glacialimarina]
MTWKNINTGVNAQSGETLAPHSLMGLDHQMALEHGVRLPQNFNCKKVEFTYQALVMLQSLNDYDQKQVIKEIEFISIHPTAASSIKQSRNPFRHMRRTNIPFRNYHYFIDYKIAANGQVQVTDILFDKQLYGSKDRHTDERTMLYRVERIGVGEKYDGAKTDDEIKVLINEWGRPTPSTQVNTAHAAVNGMLNEFAKAQWLMGTHLDSAYQSDSIKAYTLFHNPSDKAVRDLYECAFDKGQSNTSHNAQHLAAVLKQNQQLGKKVKWVAHSQGAIIFLSALQYYRVNYQGQLTGQELAIHGSGANVADLQQVAKLVGLKTHQPRNNPFDVVPNIAGKNDLSKSSFARSLKFASALLGSPGVSPHTLPFLGVKTYHQQLVMLGDHKRAAYVKKYITKAEQMSQLL